MEKRNYSVVQLDVYGAMLLRLGTKAMMSLAFVGRFCCQSSQMLSVYMYVRMSVIRLIWFVFHSLNFGLKL